MDLTQLADLGEFLGGIAVLATLIYLAVQVRQNTQSTRAAVRQESTKLSSDLMWRWSDSEAIELMQKADADFASMTKVEQERWIFAICSVINLYENLFYEKEHGVMESDLWESRVTRMRLNFTRPGIVAVWKRCAPLFGRHFRDFVTRELVAAAPLAAEVPRL